MELSAEVQQQAKAIADPSRLKIFEFIATSDAPVTVQQLMDLLGFNQNAIRQHVTVLLDAGLILESTEQRASRGRPRKLYTARLDALSAFGPLDSSYRRLAELLLEVVSSGETPYEVGYRSGRDELEVRSPGPIDDVDPMIARLAVGGFEPSVDETGDDGHPTMIRLNNCPFSELASGNSSVVCELHRGLIDGHLASTGRPDPCTLFVVDPRGDTCRVALTEAPA